MRSTAGLLIGMALVALTSASLLDMSQVLWTKVLEGGYRKIGKVDPLSIPVIKVDQSEGNTSYRVILRNLTVTGLNDSTIESVHVVRGKLKSNLSDSEAGYVSYNEQRGLDSIRYRFHTLIKEPKSRISEEEQRATEQFERIVQFDPQAKKVSEQEESSGSRQRLRSGLQERVLAEDRIYNLADMRAVLNSTPRSPSQVRVVYTPNYGSQQSSSVRPCIGACRPSYLLQQQKQQQQQQQFSEESVRTRAYQNQRYAGRVADTQASSGQPADPRPQFSASFGKGRVQMESDRFSVNSNGDSGVQFTGNVGNNRFSMERQTGSESQFAGSFGSGRVEAESQSESQFGAQEQSTAAAGNYEASTQFTAASDDVRGGNNPGAYYVGSMRDGQIDMEAVNVPAAATFDGFTGSPVQYADSEYRYLCEGQRRSGPLNFDSGLRSRIGIEPTTPLFETFEPYKAPLIRIEKQPGYVDVVYARDGKSQTSESRRVDNLRSATDRNGFLEIVKDLGGNQRYVSHNFTEGESLRKRNDEVRLAGESRRIKDLLRYAKEYQEEQGYFEQGMELIYHFGNVNKTDAGSNETLARRKRQQSNDTDEEDVMHVIVRMRVPKLGVKANYALLGQVGKQPMRGAGLLDGNFTDVTADFTVELKKVNNETMVVRAARAKLVSRERNVKLQGMDERGPVNRILSHGLMAAEAVAAMIADDLASKALNEDNNESMVYKMYKNLPVVEKS